MWSYQCALSCVIESMIVCYVEFYIYIIYCSNISMPNVIKCFGADAKTQYSIPLELVCSTLSGDNDLIDHILVID